MSLGLRVTQMVWERVHLTLTLAFDGVHGGTESTAEEGDDADLDIAAVLRGEATFALIDGKRRHHVVADHLGGNRYQIKLNVTQFNGRRQIPDGTWRITPFVDDAEYEPATYDLESADRLEDLSRVFLYDGNRTVYTVSFGFTEADDPPLLLMRTYQLFRRTGKRPGRIKRMKSFPKRVTGRANRRKVMRKLYDTVCRIWPKKGDRVLFASEQRTQIEGNLLRIRDRMVERGLDSKYHLSYSFRTPSTSSRRTALRTLYLLARADYVFIDDYFVLFDSLQLSPETSVIQVWHAGSGFKSVGYSRFGKYGSPKLSNAHRKYTYAITGSSHLVPVYAEAFGIEESAVIPTGLPRIDIFLDPGRTREVVQRFYDEHPDLRGKRLILFAPTFRGRGIKDAFYPYDRIDFDALYDNLDDDTVVLFRMHHFIRDSVPIPPEYADRMRDFSRYPSGNDLLQVVDLLITDYSSIIYEYSLLERPMLFFAYDKDVYSATRGFHRDYVDTAPGKVCVTFDALLAAMRDGDYEQWRRDAFVRENFDHVDTHSADRVIDWLLLGRPVGTPVEGQDTITEISSEVDADDPKDPSAPVARSRTA